MARESGWLVWREREAEEGGGPEKRPGTVFNNILFVSIFEKPLSLLFLTQWDQMPYLHWAYVKDARQELVSRQHGATSGTALTEHPRRSLDEAAHRNHTYASLFERNYDQVVTRGLLREKRIQPKTDSMPASQSPDADLALIMVDQLWLWILDQGKLAIPVEGYVTNLL